MLEEELRPPTTHIAHLGHLGKYITDVDKIHDQFGETWEEVYCAHPRNNDIWETFHSKCGRHIPHATFQDTPYCAEDFTRQFHRMKDTSAGFDGWTRAALRLLPMKAWHHRAMVEILAKEKGIFLDAYVYVPLSMLPKGHAHPKPPQMHHDLQHAPPLGLWSRVEESE